MSDATKPTAKERLGALQPEFRAFPVLAFYGDDEELPALDTEEGMDKLIARAERQGRDGQLAEEIRRAEALMRAVHAS